MTDNYSNKNMLKTGKSNLGFITKIVLLSFVLNVSCKGNNKSSTDESTIKYEDQLVFEVVLEAQQDDKFELYYRSEDENFNAERRISSKFNGSDKNQQIKFVFDLLEFPSHIRLDFGENEKQDTIKVVQFLFRYNDAEHIFTHQEIKKYFKPNAYLEFDYENMSAQGLKVNGKYDPFLSSYDISYFVNKLILF